MTEEKENKLQATQLLDLSLAKHHCNSSLLEHVTPKQHLAITMANTGSTWHFFLGKKKKKSESMPKEHRLMSSSSIAILY